MGIESIRVTHTDTTNTLIPSDKALFCHVEDPYVIGLVVHEKAHTIAASPHAFLGIGVEWNRDRLLDHHATFIYVYPHRGLSETCNLLGIDPSTLPIADIEFIMGENNDSEA